MTSTPAAGRSGASTLMRDLGLLVDGPRRWATPVPSRAPGVFVVELPLATDTAPIDIVAVRTWMERVPALRLDGERPEPRDLAAYLHRFWLPGEPILFVGRSPRSVGARLAALYATPLGDARPSSSGYWLKTLSVAADLRVWWAETEAHEEYEDAILSEVAARSGDGEDGLPFANLVTSEGRPKAPALVDALRDAPAVTSAPPTGRTARPPARQSPSRPTARRAPRRTAATAATDQPPAPEPAYLSPAGLASLQEELVNLRTHVRPGVIERVKAARELGDLRENSEYESARKEQSFVEGRIQTLEALVKAAVVVEAPHAADIVGVGSTVSVEADGEEQTFVLVGGTEADPAAGRISYSSPVGQALLGRRAGEEVTASLPRGEKRFRILRLG